MLDYRRHIHALLGASLSILVLPGCGKIKQMIGGDDAGAGSGSPNASAPSLEGFEGEISLQLQGGPKENPPHAITPLVLLVSNSKVRTDLPATAETMKLGKAYVILDAPAKKLSAVLDDRKEVVTIEIDKVGDQLKGMAPKGPSAAAPTAPKEPPPKIVKTDHKDTVAGYACQDWDFISQDGSKATVCFTDQDSAWFKFLSPAIPPDYLWMAEFADGKHLPLRAVIFDKTGVEQERIEITKLERKPEAPALFEIPAGYKAVDLQQMIQEFVAESMAKQGMHGGIPPMQGGMPAGMPPGAMPLHHASAHPKPALASGSSPKPGAPNHKQK
jgi:hypothetical protein